MSLLLSLLVALGPAGPSHNDLTGLSLEELMNMELTSASRKEKRLLETPSAVFVITRDDIRRSGATSLPEVLRMAPGVHVARIGASAWAVTIRGFNDRYSNKLLVMIDGRSIYTNLFSGVVWESIGIPLELIERIEVIRGPGGTMWGANAVNGVINVITRSAADTQGSELSLSAGNEERVFAAGIYGGELSDGAWRAHANGGVRDDARAPGGGSGRDDWSGYGAGFRADWGDPDEDSFLLTADAFQADAQRSFTLLDPTLPGPVFVDEDFRLPTASLLGRWTRRLDDGELSLQSFLDYKRIDAGAVDDERTTFDLDFQHRLRLGDSHELVWGLGYRVVDGSFEGSPGIEMSDEDRTDHLFSAFVQDEIQLTDDLSLTLGTKIEHNDLSGFEVQPSIRALLHLNERSSLWSAVSRAVRTPSLVDHEVVLPVDFIPGMPPVVTVITGDEDFESEELLAYEIGYRTQPSDNLFIDVTAFYFDYDNVTTFEAADPIFGPVVTLPLLFDNKSEARAIGLEIAADLRVSERWRLRGTTSLFDLKAEADGDSTDPTVEDKEDAGPSYMATLSSQHELSESLELDLAIYAVDDLDLAGVDSYVRADARVAWRPRAGLELAIGVQNLCDGEHPEFGPGVFSNPAEIERSVYASVRWRP